MRIKKYVLLVDDPSGMLSVLASDLKKLEFRVARVPGKNAALDFMRRFHKLALVVVNDNGESDRQRLVEITREVHPNLPVVLVGPDGCVARTANREWKVDGAVDAPRLQALVGEALLEYCYPGHILSTLSFSIEEALAGFQNHVVSGQAYLRATNGAVADLTALLPFSGAKISGYLAVGCTRGTAERLHENLFPQHGPVNQDTLMDMLGEVANRAIGRFHEMFEARGLSFNFGVSLFLTGKSELRAAQAHPALVMEFESPSGSVLVELFLDGLVPAPTSLGIPDSYAAAGEFVLL